MTNTRDGIEWLSLGECADELGLSTGKVRRLIEEHALIGVKRGGQLEIPAEVVQDGEPLAGLRGTMILLLDAGFDEREAIEWCFEEEATLGMTPIASLRAGRKTAVRHAVQLLAR